MTKRKHARAARFAFTMVLGLGGVQVGCEGDPPPDNSPDMLTPATGDVASERELMIVATSVVNDPQRTTGMGPWTFGYLMTQMAPKGMDAADFTQHWLELWLVDQTINSFTASVRSRMREVLGAWPLRGDGKLDLSRAPFRLLAIVNRMDLRQQVADETNAGEGRFVFGLLNNAEAAPLTLIFEYRLPSKSIDDVHRWACRWHQLGSMALGPAYNTALQDLTDRFASRGALPEGTNGSALNQMRTNDIHMTRTTWELREFFLDQASGELHQRPLDRTPDQSFQGSTRLAEYINSNREAILADRHTVPPTFGGAPFQGVTAHIPFHAFEAGWRPPVEQNVEPTLRHRFSLNTCNGCHGGETRTFFTHLSYDHPIGSPARLSGFLTGISMIDPVSGTPRTFSELNQRSLHLRSLLSCK